MVYGGAWYECGTRELVNLEHSVAVFGLCLANYIRLEPEWIPLEENEMAGYISRIMDHDKWSLDPVMFKVLDDFIQWIVLPHITTLSWSALTPDMLVLVQKKWIPLLPIGVGKVIGGVLLHVWWQG